jgi:hypothetical protein
MPATIETSAAGNKAAHCLPVAEDPPGNRPAAVHPFIIVDSTRIGFGCHDAAARNNRYR